MEKLEKLYPFLDMDMFSGFSNYESLLKQTCETLTNEMLHYDFIVRFCYNEIAINYDFGKITFEQYNVLCNTMCKLIGLE